MYVGDTLSILTETRDSPREIKGHTDNFLEVRIPSKGFNTERVCASEAD